MLAVGLLVFKAFQRLEPAAERDELVSLGRVLQALEHKLATAAEH